MLLHISPGLGQGRGFDQAQLASLTASVQQKQQQLEDDIQDYIRRKQGELRDYEQQLIDEYHQMERAPSAAASQAAGSPSDTTAAPPSPPAESPLSADTLLSSPEDGRRTKHNRVHKREKELCGFVTPLYLPLLEASPPPAKRRKEKKRQKDDKMEDSLPSPLSSSGTSSPAREPAAIRERNEQHRPQMLRAESSGSSITGEDLAESETSAGNGKKAARRPAIRKSSLRNNSTPKARRKRVSIVIDDRVVLPADNVFEAPMLSPGAANNAAPNIPGDDVIDPRLIDPLPVHSGPVHHSLPYPIAAPSTSPSKQHNGHILMDSPPAEDPPQTDTRTFLDPSPGSSHSIPQHASDVPIYANDPELEMEAEEEQVETAPGFPADDDFNTYVGGLSGSNVDNVNQAGSYGYPSSLGASYLESYMASRPLSVRMAAAERAGLAKDEKMRLLQEQTVDEVDTPVTERDVRMGEDGDEDEDDGFGDMDDVNAIQ